MKDNWKEITDPEELFKLKREGWEIEFANSSSNIFAKWFGLAWHADRQFRARPRQPKMKKVKLLVYLGPTTINLVREDAHDVIGYYENSNNWIRQPHLDLEANVPE